MTTSPWTHGPFTLAPRLELALDARCREPACTAATRGQKPYCPEHLDRLPYVKDLLSRLSRRQAEEAAAAGWGWEAIDPNGSRAREIVGELMFHGPQTPRRLAISAGIRMRSIGAYLDALERAGLIESLTIASRRGPENVAALTVRGMIQVVGDAGESANGDGRRTDADAHEPPPFVGG